MRRTIMVEKEKYQDITLGELKIPDLDLNTLYPNLSPYIKSREDIEVLLRYPKILRKQQPLEVNGYSTHTILKKAVSLKEELQDDLSDGIQYEDLTLKHPVLVSFPPELIWLNRSVDKLAKCFERILPKTEFGFNQKQSKKIINRFIKHIGFNPQTYHFWKAIIRDEFEGEKLSKILMETVIQNTIDVRGKWFTPLVPVIDSSTPGSINYSHRLNLAYGYLINDKQDISIDKTPAPLYSLYLNSSMIKSDNWTSLLEEIVKNTRIALREDIFDGIFLYVRGLNRISLDYGRVNTLLKLINELNNISNEMVLPVWHSRFGFIGFRLLDAGVSFSSFPINLNHKDVYSDGHPSEEKYMYGKIFNKSARRRWDRDQTIKSKNGPYNGLPPLDNYWNKNAPTTKEENSHYHWRLHFSKPYNTAAFNDVVDEWLLNIRKGEITPGKEYLQDFESPFCTWSN